MFGIGFFEILIIFFLIIIFIKPHDLPDFLRKVGKFYSQMRNTYKSFLRIINTYSDEVKNIVQLEEDDDLMLNQAKKKKNVKKITGKPKKSKIKKKDNK